MSLTIFFCYKIYVKQRKKLKIYHKIKKKHDFVIIYEIFWKYIYKLKSIYMFLRMKCSIFKRIFMLMLPCKKSYSKNRIFLIYYK